MTSGGASKSKDAPLAPGLYLVATPIGNLEDITLRALRVLRQADRIACEDTRQTQKLLNHYGIETGTVSYHRHNETGRAAELVEQLKAGGRIAVVSDAGTPGISDPGSDIVAEAIAAGVPVFPVPGANAAVSALIASGLPAERFTYYGFLPAKAGQRRTMLEELRERGGGCGTCVFYEAPHRIVEALEDVGAVFGAEQQVVVARELTKLHEEILRGSVEGVRSTLAGRDSVRGEMVLLFEAKEQPEVQPQAEESIPAAVRALMAKEGVTEMEALKRVARARGMGKSEAYRELQRGRTR
jgi:16S rRNA (cytidine1402-2'-O)-methyltransferase